MTLQWMINLIKTLGADKIRNMAVHGISEELKQSIREIPITEVLVMIGAQPVKKMFMCYGGHDKNSPSLKAYEKTGRYYCFGCRERGDVIGLVMNARKIGFVEACRWLMIEFNIIPGESGECRSKKKKVKTTQVKKPTQATIANNDNFTMYEWLIGRLSLSDQASGYLMGERGFSLKLIQDLEIRDLQHPGRFLPALLAHFDEKQLIDSGLCVKDEKGLRMVWWDNVIIFPYLDENFRIVNLQGRRYPKTGAKYVLLNGIPVSLYNLSCINLINRGDRLLICEGVPDTVSAIMLGFFAVGVPGANNFKQDFVDVLMDYDIHVVPHRDEAGQKFINNVKAAFKLRGKTIREFRVPPGNNDLNEYLIRKNSGL
jgi:DNA primase